MCGIAGVTVPTGAAPAGEEELRRMAGALRHRGPDGFGLLVDDEVGLVSCRLAIIDLPGGWQPIQTGPGGSAIVYNGEVYNHVELREELRAAGVRFETSSDTEVVLWMLERYGLAALHRLNGQFALAWWQPQQRRLTLVRDRFGVRPLLYARAADGSLVFASEAKALFASGRVAPGPDLGGIDEVFTLWGARAPRTVFEGVSQLPPGGFAVFEDGEPAGGDRWWRPDDPPGEGGDADLEELLRESVRLRLRADVPVGAYLSGGLDSSLIAALAQQETGGELRTFSVAFSEPGYDERAHQERVANALGTQHSVVEVGSAEIAGAFGDVIRHVETPLVRTAPVPLYLLSRDVRANGLVVVATGEGADELFWGYDLFKEVVIRELHGSEPERAQAMLADLYPYLGADRARRGPAWEQSLLAGAGGGDLLDSHLTRARATGAVKAFYRAEIAAEIGETASLDRLRRELPDDFARRSPLERASWLEVNTLLEPYLLSTQGDRVALAHGVEGRFPFLDHRVFARATRLPAERKLDGMRDKAALRDLAQKLLPPEIANRGKQPYRAPEVAPFFAPGAPDWVEESLSAEGLAQTGLWDGERVAGLLRRCRSGRATGMREGMALVGILSTQLWHRVFCEPGPAGYPPETAEPRVRLRPSGSQEPA